MGMRPTVNASAALAAVALVCGCSGGGGSASGGPPTPDSIQAATTTASTHVACVGTGGAFNDGITPFYWQVGDASGALAGGSVTGGANTVIGADSVLPIASASKWLYSSYVVQKRGGVGALSADDVRFLTFRSGYSNFKEPPGCREAGTVGGCLDEPGRDGVHTNGWRVDADVGSFAYGGGHMQVHAALNGLAGLDNAALATELRTQLGSDVGFSYGSPQPAGGAATSANQYARLLRKIVGGALLMRDALGSNAVCTNPDQAGCAAVNTPTPPGESWHYAVGHWVEDDPVVGDGAFSSPGALGFYPWIDSTRSYFGIVAPATSQQPLLPKSIQCGRAIRKAWMTGVVQ